MTGGGGCGDEGWQPGGTRGLGGDWTWRGDGKGRDGGRTVVQEGECSREGGPRLGSKREVTELWAWRVAGGIETG